MAVTRVSIPERLVRFGDCELNASLFELRRGRRTIKLERIPLQVLLMLIEEQGRVVTRESIADRIWGKGFFVDVDNGINTAIRKIRQVLNDDPQSPRFVETIAGTGYRFIAPLEPTDVPVLVAEPAHEVAPPVDADQIEASRVGVSDPGLRRDGRWATERLSSRRFDVPKPRTSLVGREQEVMYAAKLLLDPQVRLLSFIGPGGSGKSRMAIAVAEGTAEAFKGGVQFIGLGAITNPELVGDAIVKALNLLNVANRSIPQLICDQLQEGGPLLLVLDNFEQVLAAAQTVSEILAQCPFVKAVVTTRASLKIYGEQEFLVAPLMTSAAVQLFEQRSRAVRPNFAITPENRVVIEAICQRLDGLPLAIELAAARTKVLSPAAILDRLQNRLELLTGGASDLPERQKTLRRTIDWSYDLLSEEEQRLFWRFSAFVGGATIEAAEAVCDTHLDLGMKVFDGLTSLLDKNLIQRVDQSEAEPRFIMLETIREYGLERLTLSGEEPSTRRSHAAYCMVLAEEGNPELDPIAREEWLARCDAEIDNFRAALDWLLEKHELEWALRLSMALFRFWDMREHLIEGRTRLETLLRLVQGGYVKERGRICLFLGALATSQGDYAAADAFQRQSLTFYRELNDHWGIAASWNALAVATLDRGDFEEAELYFEQSLEYWRRLPDRLSTARCLHNLANAAQMYGDYERAADALAEAASVFEQVGDASGAAWSINQSGDLALEQGRIEAAQNLYRNALAAFRKTGDRWGWARSLTDLGWIYSIQGEFASAHAAYREALGLFGELGHRRGIARALEGTACLAAASGDASKALTLAAAAEHLRTQIGAPLHQAERAKLEEGLTAAREILNSSGGKGAWQKGLEMSLQAAILLALERSSSPS
jgi:predicted ATPase/DNA-binding winged helix-turn-helix (wHTH) protein